jgi:type IV pilus assembly protein PilY1
VASSDVCSDGVASPPFVAQGLDANLLMIIDNSGSMFDLAYVPDTAAEQGYCYDDSYDITKTYTGYFESDTVQWYIYNPLTEQFEEDTYTNVKTQFNAAGGTIYRGGLGDGNRYVRIVLDESVNPKQVLFFAATGNYLNWAAASKFDVEKKVLTGGKYDSGQQQLVMESRGCMDKTFIKKTQIIKGLDTTVDYYITLGIISASDNLTRIEIYDITLTGFQAADCQAAIDEFSDPTGGSLGTVKAYTTNCMDPLGTGVLASQTAFNHILQECWYFNANGDWQPGAGTVVSLKSDCQAVYNVQGNPPSLPQPDETYYLAKYAPDVQSPTDVCYGKHGTSEGYVGRCWESFYSTSYTCMDRVCNPATDAPVGDSTSPTQPAAEVCAADINKWIYCDGNYSASNQKCVGTPGNWEIRQDCVGGGGTGSVITSIDWTDDTNGTYIESGNFTDADDCVDQSLKKWCANLDDPGIVDPTDAMSSGGTTYNVPAIMMDSALESQMGDPLLSMKGLIEKTATPVGLLHEYQGQIRMGAMAFNDGPVSECAPVEQPPGSGRYVANLYDCLVDKGLSITATSIPDQAQRNGAHIISYIGKGSSHTAQLVDAINDIEATTWTPTAEAYYNAIGYYTQNDSRRLDDDDYLINSDYSGTLPSNIYPKADLANPNTIPLWTRNTFYGPSDWTTDPLTVAIVRDANNNLYWTENGGTSSEYLADGITYATEIGHDTDVVWMPFDPVQAHCQKNNILILTDGASTADQNSDVVTLAASIVDGDEILADSPYECGSLTGSTLLDDLAYYGFTGNIYPTANFTDDLGNSLTGDNIRTYLVSTGTLRDVSIYEIDPVTGQPKIDPVTGKPILKLPEECDSETLLNNAAANGYDRDPMTSNPLGELFKAENPSDLGYK